ncbi:MAG: RHS repeat-associated core domain-containing protein [Thermoanaerobaculia bacterium]|nr:RHS repeat-associated core domain-containing protein [Thermoanaerobaculia bacterium]
MRTTIMQALVIPTLLICALPLTAQAQMPSEYPTLARGVSAESVYQIGDVDSVNLYNGNLTLQIPIGPTYPVGGNLQYGLSLVYNSNAWTYEEADCELHNYETIEADYAVPDPANNGMGWLLSLGRLFEPDERPENREVYRWVYQSPDGARHGLYFSLHTSPPPNPGQNDNRYSNDGSYLRMLHPAGSCSNPSYEDEVCKIIEFPNGILHEFHNVAPAGETDWRPTYMRDRFDNWVRIDYGVYGWTLTDQHDRTQKVVFDTAEDEYAYKKIESVELSAFGGETAVYDFQWTNVRVDRHRQIDLDLACQGGLDPDPGPDVDVWTLTTLTLPRDRDNERQFYGMTYYTEDDQRVGGEAVGKAGGLEALRLPTGATYRWSYSGDYLYSYPKAARLKTVVNRNWGVVRKERLDESGNDLGAWTYSPDQADFEAPGDSHDTPLDKPCFSTTTVTDPLGNVDVHYFQGAQAFQVYTRSLPYSICDPATEDLWRPDGSEDPAGPFLSSETFDASGSLLRRIWVEYRGSNDYLSEGGGSTFETNQEKVLSRTDYYDDHDGSPPSPAFYDDFSGKWVETVLSDFDGLGHHRVQETSSNFSGSERTKMVTTNYNDGHSIFDGPPAGPWVLNTYDQVIVSEEGDSSVAVFDFDENTGFLESKTVGSETSDCDVKVAYLPDDDGNVEYEKHYGGDTVTGGCAGVGETPQYQTSFTYSSGVLSRSVSLNSSGNEVLETGDFDIDPSTGLVLASRDPAGIQVDFDYDRLGRLASATMVESEATAWVYYDYQYPTVSAPNRSLEYTIRACAPNTPSFGACTGNDRFSQSRAVFDRLGRVKYDFVLQPAAASSKERQREHRYDHLGRKTSIQKWRFETDVADFTTESQNFDRFGRPGKVIRPDQMEANFSYTGDRIVERTVKIFTGPGMEDAATKEHRDGFGRLIMVEEEAGLGGNKVRTTYRYDENDRLVGVCVKDPDSDPYNACNGGGQGRLFSYDSRGFLMSESHPELDATITYFRDSKGNVLASDLGECDSPGCIYDKSYVYDAAGRLTQVWDGSGLLEEYFYSRNNAQEGFRRTGKLYQAKRHNYIPAEAGSNELLDHVVTETYGYKGGASRLSSYSVRSSTGPVLTTSILTDPFGRISSLTYPFCDRAPCDELSSARTVINTYVAGSLTEVRDPSISSSAVASLAYHGNGKLSEIVHSNGTTDAHGRNQTDWKPIQSISTSTASETLWNHGPYEFDGAGNIYQIGDERYTYDQVSRLTSGQVVTAIGGSESETLTYDAFGNIKKIVRTSPATSLELQPDDSTNRLGSAHASYDVAGNATALHHDGLTYNYCYDATNRITDMSGAGQARAFLYTASGERFATLDYATGKWTYTPRDTGNQVLSRIEVSDGAWTRDNDYVRAGGRVVATVDGGETVRHLHLDHLGSTRLVTDEDGIQLGDLTTYYPFGSYAHNGYLDGEEIRFTGHERDEVGEAKASLDYMHARFYSGQFGRFLSVDPARDGWNLYAYVGGSPVRRLDPTGLQAEEDLEIAEVLAASTRQSSWTPLSSVSELPTTWPPPERALNTELAKTTPVPQMPAIKARLGAVVEFDAETGLPSNVGVSGEMFWSLSLSLFDMPKFKLTESSAMTDLGGGFRLTVRDGPLATSWSGPFLGSTFGHGSISSASMSPEPALSNYVSAKAGTGRATFSLRDTWNASVDLVVNTPRRIYNQAREITQKGSW